MAKRATLAVPGPLGGLPGSGRTPKALQFKNYPKAIALLDDAIEPALKVLIEGLSATTFLTTKDGKIVLDEEGKQVEIPDKWYRLNCAVQLLKKAIPDKKIKEITGPEGGPIEVNISKREAVIGILRIIEDKSLEELRREIEDGSFKLSEPDKRAEIETQTTMEGETEEKETRDRSGEGDSSG